MNRPAAIAVLVLVPGCAEGLSEPDLLLPGEELSVEWDEAWNGEGDGLGALVPVDVMVYDGATGEPVEGVQVLISADDDAVIPLPVGGVLLVEDETDPDALWDASRDQYVALRPSALGWEDLVLETDDGGIARLYLYVDAFPYEDGAGDGFAHRPVVVATSGTTAEVVRSFDLVAR